MRTYELTAVFAGSVSDTEVTAAADRVQKIITDAGATNVAQLAMGKHKLSYTIQNNAYGSYIVFTFECEEAASRVMQQKLRLSKDVIRFMLEVHVPERLKRAPQIADNPLIKASREKERFEREDLGERAPRASEDKPEAQKEEAPVDMAEIDKKLDQLLSGDLTPTV